MPQATVTRDIDSKHGTDPTHASGTKVRLAVVKQHIEEAHDAIQQGFILEDGDGTEVNISSGKEVKFVEGSAIDINWTDVSDGTDADPYDMTFSLDIASATDGTSITVDLINDKVLLLDDTDSVIKKVNAVQIAPPVEVHPFLIMGG